MTHRCAIDIGGTFTDLVGVNGTTGEVVRAKCLSTPSNLADGVFGVIEKAGIPVHDLAVLVHGSTVAINAFTQGTGAKTALLTTKGFRDVYEMGRKTRIDMYNPFFKQRTPLVPRSRRFEVSERITADGSVLEALDDEQVRALVTELPADTESVAICFLHSYAWPAHERRAAQVVVEAAPKLHVTASSDVSRELREYERTSTAVMNAYVGPRVTTYLSELDGGLRERGFEGGLLVMQSNGGMMSLDSALRSPVRTMESGPSAGVIGAAGICAELDIPDAIAFDMGGTTAKACVIERGLPDQASQYHVGGRELGFPVQVPFLDIIEVGAGGGSIASIDAGGALRVGPASAASVPGPACYGLGGDQPTVTDANVLAGRIDETQFLGGELPLDVGRAEHAIEGIASKLEIDSREAAMAILRVVNSVMSHAIRAVTVERGRDPRDHALVCYGGAAPLHAVDLAAALEIPRVVIPAGASTFAAYGMLVADVRHDMSATFVSRLSEFDGVAAEAVFGDLRAAAEELALEVDSGDAVTFSHSIDARYSGQFHTLRLGVPDPAGIGEHLSASFDLEHERRYGHAAPGEEIEITALRVTASRPMPRVDGHANRVGGHGEPTGTRSVMFESGWADCRLWQRADLASGQQVSGPAVIQEATTATVLRAGDVAWVTNQGHLVIELGAVAT
jgi:N-methylhydantoinase A